jgi:L-histidine N-alpha-methyltransferase
MSLAVPAPFHDSTIVLPGPMEAEVRAGLTAAVPYLPSKYFYDDRGSALFEEITRLPEYYQTRTEESILAAHAERLVALAPAVEVVELGSGAGRKIRLLLDALAGGGLPRRLVLFDINRRFVAESARILGAEYRDVRVAGVSGDFTGDLAELGVPRPHRLAVLFGSTIGNLLPSRVPAFLRSVAARLASGGWFLAGLDLVKDPARIEAAYNDADGVTAEFNLNILRHVNRELGADFDPARWRHRAFYDSARERIEMRLVATAHQRVRIEGAWLDLRYRPGDEIRTEYSCKYSRSSFTRLLGGTGLCLDAWFSDPDNLFALALCRREG